MVMIVHGFPNNISALRVSHHLHYQFYSHDIALSDILGQYSLCQFEWAWQNPKESRRLKHSTELARKLPRETNFNYNFRILTEMLRIGPWNRLPLIVRWLAHDFVRDFPVNHFECYQPHCPFADWLIDWCSVFRLARVRRFTCKFAMAEWWPKRKVDSHRRKWRKAQLASVQYVMSICQRRPP